MHLNEGAYTAIPNGIWPAGAENTPVGSIIGPSTVRQLVLQPKP
jgi:hypothetical protein